MSIPAKTAAVLALQSAHDRLTMRIALWEVDGKWFVKSEDLQHERAVLGDQVVLINNPPIPGLGEEFRLAKTNRPGFVRVVYMLSQAQIADIDARNRRFGEIMNGLPPAKCPFFV